MSVEITERSKTKPMEYRVASDARFIPGLSSNHGLIVFNVVDVDDVLGIVWVNLSA